MHWLVSMESAIRRCQHRFYWLVVPIDNVCRVGHRYMNIRDHWSSSSIDCISLLHFVLLEFWLFDLFHVDFEFSVGNYWFLLIVWQKLHRNSRHYRYHLIDLDRIDFHIDENNHRAHEFVAFHHVLNKENIRINP